jgi:lipid-binding SYLF domain-containing protein
MRSFHIALALAAFGFALPAIAQEDKQPPADEFDRSGIQTPQENVKPEQEVKDTDKLYADRQRIRTMADSAMKDLLASSEQAKKLHDTAYGYAVFSVVKVAVGITGGGGEGVAIAKRASNDPIYMEMATGGLGVGLGGQKYRTIFLFENQKAFDEFVFDGWEGDAEANAAAGTAGANAASSFTNGVVIYQITDKGLLANADISGTKYWMDEELNHPERLDSAPSDERERTD